MGLFDLGKKVLNFIFGSNKERIKLAKEAQLDLIKAQTMCALAIEKARQENRRELIQQIVTLKEKLMDIGIQRLAIIENAQKPILKDIETFYDEVRDKIRAQENSYNEEQMPKLLALLEKYEEGSIQYKIYSQQIMRDAELQNKYVYDSLNHIAERQKAVLDSFLESKKQLQLHAQQLTDHIVQGLLEERKQLASQPMLGGQAVNFLSAEDVKKLSGEDKRLLESGD